MAVAGAVGGVDVEMVALLSRCQLLGRASDGFKSDERSVRAPERVEW